MLYGILPVHFQHPKCKCFQPVCIRPLPGFCVAWFCSRLSVLTLNDPRLQFRKSGCQKQNQLSQDLFSHLIWRQFLKVSPVMSRLGDEYTWIFSYKNTLHLNSIRRLTRFVAQFDTCQPKLNFWYYLNVANAFNLQSGHEDKCVALNERRYIWQVTMPYLVIWGKGQIANK